MDFSAKSTPSKSLMVPPSVKDQLRKKAFADPLYTLRYEKKRKSETTFTESCKFTNYDDLESPSKEDLIKMLYRFKFDDVYYFEEGVKMKLRGFSL